MAEKKVVSIEDRIPKLKQKKRQRSNFQFILFISLFFMLILIVVYFQSSLSKVGNIEVTGNKNVDKQEIIQLSQLNEETLIWRIQPQKVAKQIEQHEEIRDVKISKFFPNTVSIEVEELTRVAYFVSDGNVHPVLETGKILEPFKLNEIQANAPLLINWLQGDNLQEMAAELRKLPEGILNRISEIHHTPTKSDPLHITLYMNDGYQVQATIRGLSKKLTAYPSIVEQIPEGTKGVIHVEVGTYFESYEQKGGESIEGDR